MGIAAGRALAQASTDGIVPASRCRETSESSMYSSSETCGHEDLRWLKIDRLKSPLRAIDNSPARIAGIADRFAAHEVPPGTTEVGKTSRNDYSPQSHEDTKERQESRSRLNHARTDSTFLFPFLCAFVPLVVIPSTQCPYLRKRPNSL